MDDQVGNDAFLSASLWRHIGQDGQNGLSIKSEDLQDDPEAFLHRDLGDLLEDDNWFSAVTYGLKAVSKVHEQLQRSTDILQRLPANHVTKELVRVFFREVGWYFPVLDEEFFTEVLFRWLAVQSVDSKIGTLTSETKAFPALLYQVLALGLQFVPPNSTAVASLGVVDLARRDKLSKLFSDAGMMLLDSLGRHEPTMMSVQADFLRTSWLKNCGRGVDAWKSLGSAIMQAQDLGLHTRSRPVKKFSTEEQRRIIWLDEQNSRLWAGLFTWDSLMAWALGRPRRILIKDCDVPPPMDTFLTGVRDQHAYQSIGREPVITCLSFQYKLAQVAYKMRDAQAHKGIGSDYGIVSKLHNEVELLLCDLPDVLRPYNTDTTWDGAIADLPRLREQIFSMANLTLMGLHRAQISSQISSRTKLVNSAIACLESQDRFFRMTPKHQYKLYGLAYYTIDAAIMLSAVTITYPPKEIELQHRVIEVLQKTAVRLDMMKASNPIAASGLRITDHCLKQVRKAMEPNPDAGLAIEHLQSAATSGDPILQSWPDLSSNGICSETDDADFWINQIAQLPDLVLDETTNFDWNAFFMEIIT